MSENKPSYIDPDKWNPRKAERTPEFVNSYLHYVGLKCLTDGRLYKLDPPIGSTELPLPDITIPEEKEIHFIDIVSPRGEEEEEGSPGSAIIDDFIIKDGTRAYEY